MGEETGSERTVVIRRAVFLSVLLLALGPPAAEVPDAMAAPTPLGPPALRPVCKLPPPGQVRCLSLEGAPVGAGAAAPRADRATPTAISCAPREPRAGCYGLRPEDIHAAYELPAATEASSSQTIAIVDPYNDPSIQGDLKIYDDVFDLPSCTRANGCLVRLNQKGKTHPLPEANAEAAREESLDVEVVHAVCEDCHILLVEASSPKIEDLEAAEDAAAEAGATEISNSWALVGEGQPAEPPQDSPAFDHPGVVITAASGDWGYLNHQLEDPFEWGPNYPASSPHVVAVGGTWLELAGSPLHWQAERVWNSFGVTGSGCSEHFAAPPWQITLTDWFLVGCGTRRAVADISAAAQATVEGDPQAYTGYAVYDSTPIAEGEAPWHTLYGTSAAAPLVAAAFALAGGSGGVAYPAQTLYENEIRAPSAVHDVVSGASGICEEGIDPEDGEPICEPQQLAGGCQARLSCSAGPGYDAPSGIGTPAGLAIFTPGNAPVRKPQIVRFTSVPPGGALAGGASYEAEAVASSGLPVSLSSQSPSVCTISESLVHFLEGGTCTLAAEQAGDGEFEPAPVVTQSFTVAGVLAEKPGAEVLSVGEEGPPAATHGSSIRSGGQQTLLAARPWFPRELRDRGRLLVIQAPIACGSHRRTVSVQESRTAVKISLWVQAPAAERSCRREAVPIVVRLQHSLDGRVLSRPGDGPAESCPTCARGLPELLGFSIEDARLAASLAGLRLAVERSPAGATRVVAQSPQPGQSLRRHALIRVALWRR